MNQLDRIIAANIILNHEVLQPIDSYGDITIQHFVDLLSAAHNQKTLDLLVKELTELIISNDIDLSEYGAIVGPKLGNVLLARSVAKRLKKPSGFVRSSILFGKYVETTEIPGVKLLLVDDVSSEQKILVDTVKSAQAGGYLIDKVFTIVDRIEGNARKMLDKRGVTLFSCRHLGDSDLANLVRELRNNVDND